MLPFKYTYVVISLTPAPLSRGYLAFYRRNVTSQHLASFLVCFFSTVFCIELRCIRISADKMLDNTPLIGMHIRI